MPVIPALVLAQADVDIEEVYDGPGNVGGLYRPDAVPDNPEMLNGGLDSLNYGGGTNSIPAWALQMGSFARGWYFGTDRFEFDYSRQFDGDHVPAGGDSPYGSATSPAEQQSQRIVSAMLSTRVFVPWDALVCYGYQAFLQQDATHWEHTTGAANPHSFEFWNVRVRAVNGVEQQLLQDLPHTRTSEDIPAGPVLPPESSEWRWKWGQKFKLMEFAKGFFQLEVSIWARIFAPDIATAKLKIPCGGVYVMALRKPPDP